jgi:hypothetical protein
MATSGREPVRQHRDRRRAQGLIRVEVELPAAVVQRHRRPGERLQTLFLRALAALDPAAGSLPETPTSSLPTPTLLPGTLPDMAPPPARPSPRPRHHRYRKRYRKRSCPRPLNPVPLPETTRPASSRCGSRGGRRRRSPRRSA